MNSQKEVVEYLTTVTGSHPTLTSLSVASRELPLFMRHLYKFWDLELFEKRIVLAVAASQEYYTPAELAKHCEQLQRVISIPVALVLPKITSYNRNRLVHIGVPFIVPGRQLFLPRLFVDLRETKLNLKTPRSKLSAGAQTVVLYQLLSGSTRDLSLAELAQKLGYSPMTLTNAAHELVDRELAETKSQGRRRHIAFFATGHELWNLAEPHLRSPIKASHWVYQDSAKDIALFEAGVSALEKVSSLANDSLPVAAQNSSRIKTWLRDGVFKKCPNQDEANLCLQEWRYDPAPFAEGNRVDRLSLFLSLRESGDERVQLALREMMEGITWQP